ncbi:MAG: hypothetical protein ACE5F4_02065 [Candidatus Paceibacteria bacterium]
MLVWLSLAVFAQFLSALTVFIDKYVLVSKEGIRSPAAFTFYTMLLSGVVVVLLPFGLVYFPTAEVAFLSTVSALLYMSGLLFLYRALQELSVTDVIPITAAFGAMTTGILATVLLTHDLTLAMLPGFLLLIIGTSFIYCFCFSWRIFFTTVAAGILIGASTFTIKLVFEAADFGNALFWPLFMNVVVALLVLAPARFFAIKEGLSSSSSGAKWMVLVSKVLGGVAFFLTFIAIALGSVSIISALGGLQLVFLFILTPLLMRRVPGVFKGEIPSNVLVLKAVGTLSIVLGLAALFVT